MQWVVCWKVSTPVFDLCLNATICRWVITWVWTELFGPMKAPQNRRKALYPNEPKNKWFNQNIDLFMVKIWSNYGKSEFRIGHFKKMTISSTFFRAFLAHKSSLKSSSWAEFELTKNKFFLLFFSQNDLCLTTFWPYLDPWMVNNFILDRAFLGHEDSLKPSSWIESK